MLKIDEKGVCQVLEDANQLYAMTQGGWRLVAVLDKEMPFPVMENVPVPFQPAGASYQVTPSFQQPTWHANKYPIFLLVQDEDVAIKLLRDELSAAHERIGVEVKEANGWKAKAAAVQKDLDALRRDHATLGQGYERIKAELADYKNKVDAKFHEADTMMAMAAALKQEAEDAKAKYTQRKTAYERILEGEFDERVEGIEAGDFGDGRDQVAGVPQDPGVHPE
jgi:hypothetical protein